MSKHGWCGGQSITEYAIVIGMVITALLAMQTFIRRYVQAEVRVKTDKWLAISDADATNVDPRLRGMQTQRLGVETFLENEGIDDTNKIFDAETASHRELTETVTGGKMKVTRNESHLGRTGRQQVSTNRSVPAPLSVPPGPWFSRNDSHAAVQKPREVGEGQQAKP